MPFFVMSQQKKGLSAMKNYQAVVPIQPPAVARSATGLHLTAQGQTLVEHAEETAAALELEATARLTAAERRTLMRLLQKIYRPEPRKDPA